MWDLELVTPPTVEPLTVAEVRERLHIGTTADDVRLGWLITQARIWAERVTNRQLLPATWRVYYPGFCGSLIVPKPPLRSVTAITYVDGTGATQTLTPTSYVVSAPGGPTAGYGVIDPAPSVAWPVTQAVRRAVTITFEAGYDLAACPIREALFWYVEYLYEPLARPLYEAALQAVQAYRVPF